MKYPRFYLVDNEIYVRLDLLDNEVYATNDLGNPYPPCKAIVNGVEITQKEFEKGAEKRQKDYPLRRLSVS